MSNKDAILQQAVELLSAHFSSVQILVSEILPNGDTVAQFNGSGDWYARTGLAHEFLVRDKAQTSLDIRRRTP